MGTSTLSSKGQLVIPTDLRNALHLQPGDKISFRLEGHALVLERVHSDRATVVVNRKGRKVLVAPADAPAMSTETVKTILAVFP